MAWASWPAPERVQCGPCWRCPCASWAGPGRGLRRVRGLCAAPGAKATVLVAGTPAGRRHR
eukprot:2670731-Lingulodinium_polyedra.AAC.1